MQKREYVLIFIFVILLISISLASALSIKDFSKGVGVFFQKFFNKFSTKSQYSPGQPVFGVLHSIYTTISDGAETPTQRVANLKNYYEWASTVDYDTQINGNEWKSMRTEANTNNIDNNFTYFLGYEWKGAAVGNAEVLVFFSNNASSVTKVNGNTAGYDTFSGLTSWLQANNGIGCINHPAKTGNVVDWNNAGVKNETYLPCVEMLNRNYYHWNDYWNCAPGSGCATYANPNPDSSVWTGGVKTALSNGLHLGFVAGWDYHGTYPGAPTAYTGLVGSGGTRQGVFDAIRKRHTWAAEDKTLMSLTINNGSNSFVMGDVFSYSSLISEITLDYSVSATAGNTISTINLFYNGEIVNSTQFSGQQTINGQFKKILRSNVEDYLFVEAVQSNGKRAWSSPLWITYQPLSIPNQLTVALISPANSTINTTTNTIDFYYLVSSANNILSCSLVVNDIVSQTVSNPIRNITNNITAYLANGNYLWSVNCTDTNNNENSSETRNIQVSTAIPDTLPPIIIIISPLNQTYTTNALNFNVSLNEAGSWCGFSLDSVPYITMNNFSSTYFDYLQTGLAEGSHNIIFSCNDTSGNINATEMRYFVVNSIPSDVTPPTFSNYIENPPNNFVYTPNKNYQFNVSINESNLAKVGIEFQWVNYTNLQNISNAFSFSITNLAAGAYSYYWWANDSSGNYNSSGIRSYNINKSNPDVRLYLNGNRNNLIVSYSTTTNATAYANISGVRLYRNSLNLTPENSQNKILAAGYYNYTAYHAGNQNFSDGTETFFLNITKATPILTFLANGETSNLTLIYPQQTNISAKANIGTVGLDKDNADYISNNALNITLGAGSYIFRANISGNQNYSDVKYSYYNITINKAALIAILTFSQLSPQNYGTAINASCKTTNQGGILKLYRNELDITSSENGQNVILGAGVYNYVCNATASQNYTAATTSNSFTINKSSTITSLTANPPSPINYGTASNFSCSNSAGLNTTLYINGIGKSNEKGQNIIRAAGNYSVNCTSIEAQNYTGSSQQVLYIVNKASQTIIPLLNGDNANLEITYPQQINASYIGTTQTGLIIKINETQINIAQNYTWGAGSWLLNYTSSSNQNYTSFTSYLNLTINKSDNNINLYLNGEASNLTLQYPRQINASASASSGTLTLYQNGIDITSENHLDIIKGAGYYNITAVSNGNQNYTSATITYWLNITKALVSLTLISNVGWNIDYLQTTSINCNSSYGTASLTRDNLPVANPFLADLLAGNFTFNCSYAGNQNYSANSVTNTLAVNKIQMPINLYIDNMENNKTIVYGTSINVTGTKQYSEGSLVLLKNGINVSNPSVEILGVNYYNYTLLYLETQNFTKNSKTLFLNVTKANINVSLLLNNNQDNLSLTYLQQLNASAASSEGNIHLYRNSIDVTNENSKNIILAAGFYEYSANSTGNQNYSANSTGIKFYANVTKAFSQISLYLNNSRNNITINNGTILINATLQLLNDNIELYKNEFIINSGLSPIFNLTEFNEAGIYNISARYIGNENYTTALDVLYVNVTNELINITPTPTVTPTITPTSTPTPGGNGNTGGGGGGGGGGGSTPLCKENWTCTEWTDCSQERLKIRICTDKNLCRTNFSRPLEKENCIPSKQALAENCTEDWSCNDWAICRNNMQTRDCIDKNNCDKIPKIEQRACSIEQGKQKTSLKTILIFTSLISGILLIILIYSAAKKLLYKKKSSNSKKQNSKEEMQIISEK